jgi:hypothetical protein
MMRDERQPLEPGAVAPRGNDTGDRRTDVLPESFFARHPVLTLLALLALAAAIVNPIRDMLTDDDGWAYARTVEKLLNTGRFELDEWSAASMPAQIYIAAYLSEAFRYSFTLLRVFTFVLFSGGVLAFYALLRQFRFTKLESVTLAMALLASPFVLMFSFSFMTDVQFLAWLLIALSVYAYAIPRRNYPAVFLGSVAAALAIGTRQFGIAILAGIAAASVQRREDLRVPARVLITAAALPLAAAVWQLTVADTQATLTQMVRLHEQSAYLSQPLMLLLANFMWRVSTIMQYSVFCLLAIMPAVLWTTLATAMPWRTRRWPKSRWVLLAGCLGLVLAGPLLAPEVRTIEEASRPRPRLLPSLPWVLRQVIPNDWTLQAVLTVLSFLLAFALIWNVARALSATSPRHIEPNAAIVGTTALALLALHLCYVQLNDTYVLVFVPFLLILLGQAIRQTGHRAHLFLATRVMSMLTLVILTLGLRGDFNKNEAAWHAARNVVSQGVAPSEIMTIAQWNFYHSMFDRWMAEVAGTTKAQQNAFAHGIAGRFHETFFAWWGQQVAGAQYWIYPEGNSVGSPVADVVSRVPYRDGLFRQRFLLVERRRS